MSLCWDILFLLPLLLLFCHATQKFFLSLCETTRSPFKDPFSMASIGWLVGLCLVGGLVMPLWCLISAKSKKFSKRCRKSKRNISYQTLSAMQLLLLLFLRSLGWLADDPAPRSLPATPPHTHGPTLYSLWVA